MVQRTSEFVNDDADSVPGPRVDRSAGDSIDAAGVADTKPEVFCRVFALDRPSARVPQLQTTREAGDVPFQLSRHLLAADPAVALHLGNAEHEEVACCRHTGGPLPLRARPARTWRDDRAKQPVRSFPPLAEGGSARHIEAPEPS